MVIIAIFQWLNLVMIILTVSLSLVVDCISWWWYLLEIIKELQFLWYIHIGKTGLRLNLGFVWIGILNTIYNLLIWK